MNARCTRTARAKQNDAPAALAGRDHTGTPSPKGYILDGNETELAGLTPQCNRSDLTRSKRHQRMGVRSEEVAA
jgi:hypothetical protein